jgi:hypothetical protein
MFDDESRSSSSPPKRLEPTLIDTCKTSMPVPESRFTSRLPPESPVVRAKVLRFSSTAFEEGLLESSVPDVKMVV